MNIFSFIPKKTLSGFLFVVFGLSLHIPFAFGQGAYIPESVSEDVGFSSVVDELFPTWYSVKSKRAVDQWCRPRFEAFLKDQHGRVIYERALPLEGNKNGEYICQGERAYETLNRIDKQNLDIPPNTNCYKYPYFYIDGSVTPEEEYEGYKENSLASKSTSSGIATDEYGTNRHYLYKPESTPRSPVYDTKSPHVRMHPAVLCNDGEPLYNRLKFDKNGDILIENGKEVYDKDSGYVYDTTAAPRYDITSRPMVTENDTFVAVDGIIGANNDGRIIPTFFPRFARIMMQAGSAILLFMFIFTGVRMIYAMDNEEEIENAKKYFVNMLLGMMFMLLSYSMVRVIYYYFAQGSI